MAVDTAAKRASALAGLNHPYLRLVVPDGSVDLAAAAGMYNGFSAGEDVTAPTVSSWTVAADGLSSSIVHSEAVTRGTDGITGLVLTPTNGGAAVTLTYSSGDGTDTLVVTHSRAISSTETLTRSYTQPGDGIQDATGNLLDDFTAQSVTNDSTENAAPTDLILSGNTVLTTAGLNANVGTFSTIDPDAGDTFTYTLVAGTGDTDNLSFSISGATLRVDDPSGMSGPYSIRAQTEDSATNPRAEVFQITVSEPGTRAIIMNPVQSPIGEIVVNPVVT